VSADRRKYPDDFVPQEAIDYLAAVRRYYQTTKRPPTNDDMRAEHDEMPARSWDRRKHDLRHKWPRDYLEVWPPPRDWHPSWEHLIKDTPPQGQRVVRQPAFDDGQHPVLIEEVFDANGVSIRRRLINTASSIAAVIATSTIMDVLSDGRLDGIVRFVRMCMRGRVM